MALDRDTSKAQITFDIEGGSPEQFMVMRYRGTEGLSRMFRFEIEAATTDALSFAEIISKACVLSVNSDYGTRWFHGIVSRLEVIGEHKELTYCRIEVVPSLWLLTLRSDCKIFQAQNTEQIATSILTGGGISADKIKFNISGSRQREYCVQYRETDFNFFCRLMEEEGFRWYFENTQEGQTLHITDVSTYEPIAGDSSSLAYNAPTGMTPDEEHVYRLQVGETIRQGSVALNEYNFENPQLELLSKSEGEQHTALQFYDYPGIYKTAADGPKIAKVRLEEFEALRRNGAGRTNSPRMEVGKSFELTDHPSGLDGKYMICSLVHQGRQSITQAIHTGGELEGSGNAMIRPMASWNYHAGQVSRDPAMTAMALGEDPLKALSIPSLLGDDEDKVGSESPIYDCRFEMIPDEVAYRPPRITPWPVMRGAQTARVVGPKDEEIYCDEFGRIKVQFNWDRQGEFNENSSCYVPVSQGMAGGQYGMMFLPRIGHEVIVDFLEGDPNQPICTGRVFNNDQMPPYSLPDHKTRSTIKTNTSKGGGGTNEIRFEDLKGSEQILIHAEKDLHLVAKNNLVQEVGNQFHLKYKSDTFTKNEKSECKEIGENTKVKIGGDDSLEIAGKQSIKIGGTQALQVAGDVVHSFDGNHKHEVSQTCMIKGMSVKIEASTGIELKCGGSSIVLTPAAIFITGGPMVNINSGSGPPVAPPMCNITPPEAPEPPEEVEKADPGKDTKYARKGESMEEQDPQGHSGQAFEPEESEEQPPTSFIDLELVDEEGNPCAGEKYIVVDSTGEEHKGSLDANGKAHVVVPEGKCDVFYPDLDKESWERSG